MYKDFKKTESLDTGFVGGSGIVWMFSGIVIGLLVGLGMYYFSNLNTNRTLSTTEMTQASEQRLIKQGQLNQRPDQNQLASSSTGQASPQANSAQASSAQSGSTQAPMKNLSLVDEANRTQQPENKKSDTNFSYYAVLPNLDVPVGSVKAIDIRDSARDRVGTAQVSALKKQPKEDTAPKSKAKGKNKASEKNRKGKYFLQIASFKRKSSANVALRALLKRGIKASIQKKKISGRLWYRISVGSLNKVTANRWKKKAEKLGHKPRLIQLKK